MNYFGTDGIRKVSSFFDESFLSAFCNAISSLHGVERIVIGRDTRTSGSKIERFLAEKLASHGKRVYVSGIIPSPALSYNVVKLSGDLGIMISASHNPPEDNGIKLFSPSGAKISEEIEERIEDGILRPEYRPYSKGEIVFYDGIKAYREFVASSGYELKNKKILLDCAYGAASKVAKKIFLECGADVISVNDEYRGDRINVNCGATHINEIKELSKGFDVAFSFDGDADRVIAVKKGKVYDGDRSLYSLARVYKAEGKLRNNGVCGTVMTNSGAEKAYLYNGIKFYRSAVGDRNVYETMVKNELRMGGESSGHVIVGDYLETGDGIRTALEIARADKLYGLENVADYKDVPSFGGEIIVTQEEKERFSAIPERSYLTYVPDGVRAVVRASGTENKIRITCECEDEKLGEITLKELTERIRGML